MSGKFYRWPAVRAEAMRLGLISEHRHVFEDEDGWVICACECPECMTIEADGQPVCICPRCGHNQGEAPPLGYGGASLPALEVPSGCRRGQVSTPDVRHAFTTDPAGGGQEPITGT